ncbi:MAG: HEAT repeat domain-containing protein [Anaerolineae bacterium]|nr:HEAT repeat domain-containing protein [Anaerolineae bacterium]
MLDTYLLQLRSDDPAQRRAAIIALANSRDPAALRPLAETFKNDPDPALRELALKAGRYLRQYPREESVVEGEVAERDRDLAKKLLDAATNYHLEGDKGRAVENLGKALSLNPALHKEPFAANLVMTLTHMSVADAMPLLTHPDRRHALVEKIGGKRTVQRQAHGKGAETATWDNVAIDFLLYALVVALSLAAIFVFTLDTIRELIDTAPSATITSEDLDVFFEASAVALFVLGAFYGLYSALTLALQGAAVHVVAAYLFAGNGTLVHLYRRLVPFQTYVMLVFALLFIGLALTGSVTMFWLAVLITVVGSFAILYFVSKLVGEVYEFGAGMGCLAIFLGGVLMAVVAALGNWALGGLLSGILSGLS